MLYSSPSRARLKDPASSVEHAMSCIEAAMRRAKEAGGGKFVLCVDLKGLGLRDLNPTTATTSSSYILNHYPGQIGQVVILDSPWTFKVRRLI